MLLKVATVKASVLFSEKRERKRLFEEKQGRSITI